MITQLTLIRFTLDQCFARLAPNLISVNYNILQMFTRTKFTLAMFTVDQFYTNLVSYVNVYDHFTLDQYTLEKFTPAYTDIFSKNRKTV